ncbi:hypothetical protein LWI29_028488 [Acer saccharum]|uniref:Putative plant transposon protein domain-containing protein n=1 Tax=Acer saccharum TaxID=4024 RepID=A0AA39T5R8_ACESA|nr:hypothetical protein LWI29_028488 [Acer saccharum]
MHGVMEEDENLEVEECAKQLNSLPLRTLRGRWHFEELGVGKPKLPPSIEKPPTLELKQLPSHLRRSAARIVPKMPPKSNKRARPGEGSSAGESQEATPCVRNRDYATRKAILMVRPIIHERGIHVSTLENTTIPTIVEARKWEKFVASRGLANLTWSALPLGYASFDGDSEKLAKLLRGNDDGVWTKKHPIRQSDLSKDVALMNLFNSSSLRPVSHTSSISVKRAELVACYLTGGLIDVGRVIKAELNEAGDIDLKNKSQAKKKPVSFPYLITVLCREAGVPEFDNDEWAKGDKGDLNLRSWNDTTSKTKGRRKLWKLPSPRPRADSGPEESDEEDEEDEDFEPQEEELQFGEAGQAGSSEMSQFNRIMKAIAGN